MKKILIAVLAVAVLFGFAACNDGSSSTTGGIIAGATVTGGGEKVYIPGETIDLSDYAFSLTMADGSTQPADASDFVFNSLVVPAVLNDAESEYVAGTVTIAGSYKGMTDAVVGLKVNVAKVTKIELSGTPATKEYFATSAATDASDIDNKYKDGQLDLTGLTVTATYVDKDGVNGTREIASTNANLSASIADWKNVASKTDAVLTVKFGTVGNVEDTLSDVIKLKPNRVQTFALKATEGYTLYAGSTEKVLSYTATPSTAAGVYAELTYENGEVVIPAKASQDIIFASSDDGIEGGSIVAADLTSLQPAKEGTFELFAYYKGTSVTADIERTQSVELSVVKNGPAKLEIALVTPADFKEGGAALANYSNNVEGFKALLKVTTKLADGAAGTEVKDYTLDPSTRLDLTGMVQGDVVVVKVTATVDGVALEGSAELVVAAKA